MAKIVSKRGKPPPAPAPAPEEVKGGAWPFPVDGPRIIRPTGGPRIIIKPDGSWGFPEHGPAISPNDEEVIKKTTDGVDVNYIQMGDC